MPEVILKINKKSFKLEFGFELFRILGRKWDLPGINEVLLRVQILEGLTAMPSFEQMDVLEDLLKAAIQNGEGPDVDLSGLKILEEFLKEPESIESFFESLTESLPQNKPQDDSGKPKARNSKKA